jgi:hypothetical protein
MQTDTAVGWFSSIALGGTVERKVSRHFLVRIADFEYQFNGSDRVDNSTTPPTTTHVTVHPYGISAGVGYKIF